MKNFLNKALLFLFTASLFVSTASAQGLEEEAICAVYVTGIGCPHCAEVDPVLLEEKLQEHSDFVIIEYEIYQESGNAGITLNYNNEYETGFGIPLLVFSKEKSIVGDKPILDEIDGILEGEPNTCPLLSGGESIQTLDITTLPGSPNIWRDNRVLIPDGKTGNATLLRKLLLAEDVRDALFNINYEAIEAEPVPYSGGEVEFKHAVRVGGWILKWNDDGEPLTTTGDAGDTGNRQTDIETTLTLTKLISLAIVDAVNPCALAVLTLLLIAIFTYNPNKKHRILMAGLYFTAAVFIMYMIYGLLIIRFFQLIQAITSVRLILYNVLGAIAIILGLLNLKDVISYKPGGFATEMPLFMRPKMKAFISRVTSPKGAFLVGLFVTLFLLPCTIGPYVIAGGILSTMEVVKTIPPLLLYNFIFVLPMLIITGLVYFGISRVEDVSEWKDKNVRRLHLIAGVLMLALGIAMIMGWV